MKRVDVVSYNGKKYFDVPLSGVAEVDGEQVFTGIPLDIIEIAYNKQCLREIDDARLKAYRQESDPLYMEWQYDKTPEAEQAWRDKVEEIKLRLPLPEDVRA